MTDQTIDFDVIGTDLDPADARYRQMRLIRMVEEKLLELFSLNMLAGTTHTSIGQEANAAGIIGCLDRDRDMVWSNHRCHGHFLVYCGQTRRLLAEILGRATGACGGRGGSQHLHWRNFYSSGIQGGFLNAAVGAAYAEKRAGAVGVAFLGDGTMGEGAVYEALNLASLHGAPILFVVEDNGIAQTTPKPLAVSGSITERAAPFGVATHHARSTDADEIASLAAGIVGEVRSTGRPAWLHIETVRLGPHSKGDDTRSEDELAAARARDPLTLYRPRVAEADALDAWCAEHLEAALTQAMEDPPACG